MFLGTAVVQPSGPYFSKQPVKVTAPEGHLSDHQVYSELHHVPGEQGSRTMSSQSRDQQEARLGKVPDASSASLSFAWGNQLLTWQP